MFDCSHKRNVATNYSPVETTFNRTVFMLFVSPSCDNKKNSRTNKYILTLIIQVVDNNKDKEVGQLTAVIIEQVIKM